MKLTSRRKDRALHRGTRFGFLHLLLPSFLALLAMAMPARADLLVIIPAGETLERTLQHAVEREGGEVFFIDNGLLLARIDERSYDLVERLSVTAPLLQAPCVGWAPPCSNTLVPVIAWVEPSGRDDFVAALEDAGGAVAEEFPAADGTIFLRFGAPAHAIQPLSERPEVDRLFLDGQGVPPGGQSTLFLGEGWRFRAEAQWQTSTGSGPAVPVQWTTDTGAFYFFRRDNVELTVKVLDGCALTGHYWVFASGMTNVGVTLTVESATAVRTYTNPLGRTFETITDTLALPCK